MTDEIDRTLPDGTIFQDKPKLRYPEEIMTDRLEALTADNERLREALVAEREENLWSAYATGDVIGDEWTHLFMSDGEWLAKECGFDPRQGYYSAEAIRNAIPIAARAALGDTQ